LHNNSQFEVGGGILISLRISPFL